MIISLDDLKDLLKITKSDNDEWMQFRLDAIETMIVNKTNNKFINPNTKICDYLKFENNQIIGVGINFVNMGYSQGNDIVVFNSKFNDGHYIIESVNDNTLTLTTNVKSEESNASIGVVNYPYDIISGVVKLMDYDIKMADKIGVKSETISRYSVTYYDMNSSENVEGFPSALLAFIKKYKKMGW